MSNDKGIVRVSFVLVLQHPAHPILGAAMYKEGGRHIER